jgi:amino acid adenylation domain-containing protein
VRALFDAQVARTPNAPAVIFDDKILTYSQLNGQADQLAGYLKNIGVGPESFVSICMDRSLEMVVAILGVLKAGGAYAPLDPAYPRERLSFILAETRSSVLLTQTDLRANLPQSAVRVICVDADWEQVSASVHENAPDLVSEDGRSALCVIYTSGSTGKPKGVVLENRGIVNLIDSFIRSYEPASDDRILPLTSVGSASFVGEIFPLLCVGGTLVLARAEEFLDLDRLFELIIRQRVSIISAVPTVIAGLNQKKGDLTSLRWLLSGGEALDIEDIDELLKSVSIVNSYGLTETSVCSMFYKVNSEATGARSGVPIGTPIINTEVYVLDPDLNCLPVGCPGEL